MFATATRNFVQEVDRGGQLIPVSSLNDTIALLTVVVKRNRFWLWQKAKYIPTDFTLNDILAGDIPITPGVMETDFIKYDGTFGDNIQATVDANFVSANVSFEGKESSKLQSSFGSLKKEELEVQKLLQDCKERILDMSHGLIQQTKEKPRRRVFGIVKERILTSQPCSVIEEVQQGAQFAGGLILCGRKCTKVSLKENGSLSKDSNITMEIPVLTPLAYSLIELEVKNDGRYELCLMSYTSGFLEVDGLGGNGPCSAGAAASGNSHLRQELEPLRGHFQVLASLPATTRSSLLQQITHVMADRRALASLQNVVSADVNTKLKNGLIAIWGGAGGAFEMYFKNVSLPQLEQMCIDKTAGMEDHATTPESQQQSVRAILDLLELCGQVESRPALSAFHLITSAMDEMTDHCLSLLGMCCSLTVLPALALLVQCVSGSGKGELPLSGAGPAALTGDVYQVAERLFASSNVSLTRDGSTVTTTLSSTPVCPALVLCIAVRGLASLARCD